MKALDLGSSRVLPTVLKLVIPAMIAQFINVLYSIVDRMYVGNIAGIGDTALAAVGVCAPITTLISSFAFLIGTGGAPLFAMALGEGKEETSKKILTNALYSLAAIALIVTAIVFAFEKPLLMTFGASGSTYAYARQYLLIYAAGALFSITATGLNQYITAQGYSGMGMLTTVIGAAANIALDPLFIFVFRMNVAGAALATVLSQFLSFLFVAVFLLLKSTKIRLSLGRASLRLIGKIVKLGISPFIIMATDSVIIIVSNAVLQSRGGADGDLWITVSTVVQAFFQLITMPMMGISTGSQPVISYNYGAKNTALIKIHHRTVPRLYRFYDARFPVCGGAVRFAVHLERRDRLPQRLGDPHFYDRRNSPLLSIRLGGRVDGAGPAAVRHRSLAHPQIGRLPRLYFGFARLLGRAGGFLRRTRGRYLRRDLEFRRLFNRLPQNFEKAGSVRWTGTTLPVSPRFFYPFADPKPFVFPFV